MAATSVITRMKDEGYKRWLKAGRGLLEMKAALGPAVTAVIQQLHADVKAKVAALPSCTTCSTRDIDRTTGTFTTGCSTHNTMQAEILAHHTAGGHPRSVNWDNTDASQWNTDEWTIAKLFMGRGVPATNTGVADTDASNLCILMTKCKDFKSTRVVHNQRLVDKVVTVRNETMHSPDMSLDEPAMKAAIGHLIALLQDHGLAAHPACVQGMTNLIQIRDSAFFITPEYELDIMKQRLDALNIRLDAERDALRNRVDTMDQRQDAADQALRAVDQSLAVIDQHCDAVEDKFKEVDHQSTEHEHQIRALKEQASKMVAFMKKNPDLQMQLQADCDLLKKNIGELDQRVTILEKMAEKHAAEISDINEKIRTPASNCEDTGNTLECLQCELVDTYKEHFKNLQPVPWVDVKLDINLVYQEQTLEGREDMWRQHDRASEVKDIFLPLSKGEARPKLTLVEGAPGMGKTTLCQRLLQDWVQCIQPSQCGSDDSGQHLKDFQLVVFLRERDVTSSDLWFNLQENLLSDRWDDKENLAGCMRSNKEQVLFLIDGYDEGSESQKGWTDGWLKGREMRGATIIITSRPGFCKPQPPPDRMYTLKGFDEQMQTKFIKEFNSLMGAKEMGETSMSDLLTPFQGQDILQIPIFLAILCFLAMQGQDVLPKSTTNLYKEFVKFMSDKALDEPAKFSKNYVSKLQMWLQEIAFLLFEIGKSEITIDVLAKHVSDSEVKETMDNLCKLGLVCQEIKLKGTDTFQAGTFIHQSFKDYFSALHFFSLQRKERSRFIENTEIHHNVFVFVAGLCEAGGHKELFTQLLSAWKQEVEAKVKLPAFDGSDSVENDMDLMYRQTGDLHSLLHAPLLWLNQLSDPVWLSADNMAAITQTTKAIHLTPHCVATCSRGLLALIKACTSLRPLLSRSVTWSWRSPLRTLRQAISKSSVSLTSGTPLHIAMYALHLDGITQVELMHHTLQSRDSVRCVQLSLPAYTPEACARLADLVPDITHLVYLAIWISSWESLDIVSRGFQPSSLLRRIAVYCTPSSSSDTLSAAQPVWSPSTDFIPAIKCLDQLRWLQMGDNASILSHDNRRNIHCLISSEMPKVSLEIYDWDPDINQYKTDTSCLPDRQTNS